MTSQVGYVSKMRAVHQKPVHYELMLNGQPYDIQSKLGHSIRLRFTGSIQCVHCQRSIKKTYNQGYCFPCSQTLAQCDLCILKPERCHYHLGTCREPDWGLTHCMVPHVAYLSTTSDLKVGLTRQTQVPIRWMDQGASQALPLLEVKSRYLAGLIEDVFRSHVQDKTNWRKLLKGDNPSLDLNDSAHGLLGRVRTQLDDLKGEWGAEAVTEIPEPTLYEFEYPILSYPEKIKSLSFDKNPEVAGQLMGIKGQYLILDCGVLNMRKFTGYEVEVSS